MLLYEITPFEGLAGLVLFSAIPAVALYFCLRFLVNTWNKRGRLEVQDSFGFIIGSVFGLFLFVFWVVSLYAIISLLETTQCIKSGCSKCTETKIEVSKDRSHAWNYNVVFKFERIHSDGQAITEITKTSSEGESLLEALTPLKDQGNYEVCICNGEVTSVSFFN